MKFEYVNVLPLLKKNKKETKKIKKPSTVPSFTMSYANMSS